jgi:hypothetical protein
MRWGFAWSKGPFEMMDELGPMNIINKCKENNIIIPAMLETLLNSNSDKFYTSNNEYLTIEGEYNNIPK